MFHMFIVIILYPSNHSVLSRENEIETENERNAKIHSHRDKENRKGQKDR